MGVKAGGCSHSLVLVGRPSIEQTLQCAKHMTPEADNVDICICWCRLIYGKTTVDLFLCPGARWLNPAASNQPSLVNRNWGSRQHGVMADGATQWWSHPRLASTFHLGEETN